MRDSLLAGVRGPKLASGRPSARPRRGRAPRRRPGLPGASGSAPVIRTTSSGSPAVVRLHPHHGIVAEVLVAAHHARDAPGPSSSRTQLLGTHHDPDPARPPAVVPRGPTRGSGARDCQARPRGAGAISSSPSAVCTIVPLAVPSTRLASPRNWASSASPGQAVEAGRGVDLGDHPAPQDRHLVGHGQRLVLVVGDQDGRGARPGAARRAHRPAPRPAARRRGRRRARRGGRSRGRGPGRGPGRRAAAAPRRADGGSGGPGRPGRPVPTARRPASRGDPPGPARRPRCARRSDAGRGHPPGARSRSGAARRARTGWPASSTTSVPRRTSPASGRSNPAMIRNRVVLPLPDGPRMAVNEPAGHLEVDPGQHGRAPERLGHPGNRQALHRTTIVPGAGPGASPATLRAGRRSNQRPRT